MTSSRKDWESEAFDVFAKQSPAFMKYLEDICIASIPKSKMILREWELYIGHLERLPVDENGHEYSRDMLMKKVKRKFYEPNLYFNPIRSLYFIPPSQYATSSKAYWLSSESPEVREFRKEVLSAYHKHVITKSQCPFPYSLLPGEGPEVHKYETNSTSYKSFPPNIFLSNTMYKDTPFFENDFEKEWSDAVLRAFFSSDDLIVDPIISFPKDSSIGFPFPFVDDDLKAQAMDNILINYKDILSDFSALSLLDIFHKYGMSKISMQGERLQVEAHGDKGKERVILNPVDRVHTVVDLTPVGLHGQFAKRARPVLANSALLAFIINILLQVIRKIYSSKFFATYKVTSSQQLNNEFQNAIFACGWDVSQLDQNTSPKRIDYYHAAWLKTVQPHVKKPLERIFKMLSRGCLVFKPLSKAVALRDNHFSFLSQPIIINDPFSEPSDEDVCQGIPSGSPSTSDDGKIEMTCYNVININYAIDFFTVSSGVVLKAARHLYDKGYLRTKLSFETLEKKGRQFIGEISQLSKDDFVHQFLSSHFNGRFIFKNMGDDTVFGSSDQSYLLHVALLLVIVKSSQVRKEKLESQIAASILEVLNEGDLEQCKCCSWHKLDFEEPIKYLGNVLYSYPIVSDFYTHNFVWLPNPQSYITNFLFPEKSLDRSKKFTWGISIMARNDQYSLNPICNQLKDLIDDIYLRIFYTSGQGYTLSQTAEMFNSAYGHLVGLQFDSLNDSDKIALMNKEAVHYKVNLFDLSPIVRKSLAISRSPLEVAPFLRYVYGEDRVKISDNFINLESFSKE